MSESNVIYCIKWLLVFANKVTYCFSQLLVSSEVRDSGVIFLKLLVIVCSVLNSEVLLRLAKGAEECPLLLASEACSDKACVYSVK